MALTARVILGVIIAGLSAALFSSISAHDQERRRWEHERATLGTPAYDPGASDAAYEASRKSWAKAGTYGPLLAAAIAALLLTGDPRQRPRGIAATKRALWLSALIDVAVVVSIACLGLLDDGESALVHAATNAAPVVAVGAFVLPLCRIHQTAGLAATRNIAAATLSRSLVALLCLPLGVLWPGVHYRFAGLTPLRQER